MYDTSIAPCPNLMYVSVLYSMIHMILYKYNYIIIRHILMNYELNDKHYNIRISPSPCHYFHGRIPFMTSLMADLRAVS